MWLNRQRMWSIKIYMFLLEQDFTLPIKIYVDKKVFSTNKKSRFKNLIEFYHV